MHKWHFAVINPPPHFWVWQKGDWFPSEILIFKEPGLLWQQRRRWLQTRFSFFFLIKMMGLNPVKRTESINHKMGERLTKALLRKCVLLLLSLSNRQFKTKQIQKCVCTQAFQIKRDNSWSWRISIFTNLGATKSWLLDLTFWRLHSCALGSHASFWSQEYTAISNDYIKDIKCLCPLLFYIFAWIF